MIPLRSRTGAIDYIVGGQICISGALASRQSLSFLLGSSSSGISGALEDKQVAEIAKNGANQDLELSAEVIAKIEEKIGKVCLIALLPLPPL